MAEYDLGTARGRIVLDATGAAAGIGAAGAAAGGLGASAAGSRAGLGIMSVGLLGVGVAAVAGFGAAISAAADFEKSISVFESVTGTTGAALDKVREKALQLGADTKFSALEAVDAMNELGKAGISTEDILGGAADATVALAAAGEIDLAQAAAIASAAMNQFNLTAAEAPKIADLLAGAANASATGVQELGDALRYVGPSAAAAGLSIEDTAAFIAVLANNGIDASSAGTGLRGILVGLQPQSDKAAAAMEKLGLVTADGANAFFDAEGNMKSAAEVSKLLRDSFSGLTKQQQLETAETIFGRNSMSSLAAIVGTTEGEFSNLQSTIEGTSAAEVAATRMDNLSGSMEELKGSIETLLIKAGLPLQDGLQGIVDAITGVVNWVGNLSPEIQKLIGWVLAGVAAFALIGGAITLVTALGGVIAGAFTAFGGAILSVLGVIFSPIGLIIAAVVGLGFILVKLWQTNEDFRNGVKAAWEAVLNAVQVAWEWIKTNVPALWDEITDAAKIIWMRMQPVIENLQGLWQQFLDFAERNILPIWEKITSGGGAISEFFANEVLPLITDKVLPAIESFGKDFIDALIVITQWLEDNFFPTLGLIADFITKDVIPAVEQFVSKAIPYVQAFGAWVEKNILPIVAKIGSFFISAGKTVGEALGTAVTWLSANFMPILTTVATFVTQTLAPAVASFATTAIGHMMSFVEWIKANIWPVIVEIANLFMAIAERIKQAWDLISPYIDDVLKVLAGIIFGFVVVIMKAWDTWGEDLLSGVKKAWDAISGALKIAWDVIKGIVEGALQVIKGIIQVVTGIISLDWDKTWNGIKSIFGGVWDIIKTIVSGSIDAVKLIIQTGIATIGLIWDTFWTTVKTVFSGIWESIKWAATSGVGGLITLITSLPGKILSAIGDVGKLLWDTGKKILQSLIDGITSKWNDLKGLLEKVTDFIPDWKGPKKRDEKLLTENGRAIMGSLIGGINGQVPALKSALSGVTGIIAGNGAVMAGAATGPGGSSSVTVQFNINAPGGDASAIRTAVSQSSTIASITRAARAGVARRAR